MKSKEEILEKIVLLEEEIIWFNNELKFASPHNVRQLRLDRAFRATELGMLKWVLNNS